MKIVWYSIFSFLMLLCIGVALYFYFMKNPAENQYCAYGCDLAAQREPWMNGPLCNSVKETELDPSIPAPSQIPYLSDFIYSPGAGSAFCSPAWYAFRYVRNKDGAYGPLSKWSGSSEIEEGIPLPIYACAQKLPCIPSSGSSSACAAAGIPVGSNTSTFNAPTLALVKALDIDTKAYTKNGYTLNVHRQVGYIDSDGKVHDFDPNSEGDIVGFFIEYPGGPRKGIYASFYDVLFPPQSNNQTACC